MKANKFNDLSINNGFPEQTTRRDYPLLTTVVVMWCDSPDTLVLITFGEKHSSNYKGEISFKGIDLNRGEEFWFQSTQIKSIHKPADKTLRFLKSK